MNITIFLETFKSLDDEYDYLMRLILSELDTPPYVIRSTDDIYDRLECDRMDTMFTRADVEGMIDYVSSILVTHDVLDSRLYGYTLLEAGDGMSLLSLKVVTDD